ncbi:Arginase-1 [Echinococcus multilocularis]|uniref:Arginase-1 n=1 Tax=Echinococcus multilocularis TaxID=6211 RepID=A0A0S4MKL1_ECHMU|nr:Arginase-1 [Echinococcus multilocularis]
MTLILGGDHSIGSGSIVGHFTNFPNSFVVWVDAHADINTPQSSASRHTHGMPISFVLTETNLFHKHTALRISNQCMFELLYIGLRDFDSPERPNSQVNLSFRIDSLDPKYASCTGTPVPGGLSLEEGKYICKVLAQTGHLRSMVLAEVNTSLGSPKEAKTTVNSAVELIKSALLLDWTRIRCRLIEA